MRREKLRNETLMTGVSFIPAHKNVGDWGERKKAAGMGNGSVEPKTKLVRPTC